jgi:hypothetical protein
MLKKDDSRARSQAVFLTHPAVTPLTWLVFRGKLFLHDARLSGALTKRHARVKLLARI